MQASQEQEAAPPAGRQGGNSGAGGGRAEFKAMFVSLVDPAGLLDMERCAEKAGRMRQAALESGYHAGARMSSILADTFAAADDIAGRPVDDGALHHTTVASRFMMEVLYDTAEAYRDGGDSEPVSRLEDVRDRIRRLASDADEYRKAVRSADPPGSGLPRIYVRHMGRICRDVIREEQEEVRAREKEKGRDPIFPPEPRPIDDFFGDCDDPDITPADMIAEIRGRGPPEGYKLVKIEDHERWKGQGHDRLSRQ